MAERLDFAKLGSLAKTREKQKAIIDRAAQGDINLYYRLEEDAEVWCFIKGFVGDHRRLNAGWLIEPKKIDQATLLVMSADVLKQASHFGDLQCQYFDEVFCLDESGGYRILKSMKRNYLPGRGEQNLGIDIFFDYAEYDLSGIREQIAEGGVCEHWENENDAIYEVRYASDLKDAVTSSEKLWGIESSEFNFPALGPDSRYQRFAIPFRFPVNRLVVNPLSGGWSERVLLIPVWNGFSVFNRFSSLNEDVISLYKDGLKDPAWLGRLSGVAQGGKKIKIGDVEAKTSSSRWYLKKSAVNYSYKFGVYGSGEKVLGFYHNESFIKEPRRIEVNVKDLIVDRSAYERKVGLLGGYRETAKVDGALNDIKKDFEAEAASWLEGQEKGFLTRVFSAKNMVSIASLAIAFWDKVDLGAEVTREYKKKALEPSLNYKPKHRSSLIEMITLEWDPDKSRSSTLKRLGVASQPWKNSHLDKVIEIWRDLADECLNSDWSKSQLTDNIKKALKDNQLPERYVGVIRFVMLGNGVP